MVVLLLSGGVTYNIEGRAWLMKPGDLLFTAKVGGRDYAVTVTFQTFAYRSTLYDDLTVTMKASELYCDGKAYSLTDNGITYVIDNAKKVKE